MTRLFQKGKLHVHRGLSDSLVYLVRQKQYLYFLFIAFDSEEILCDAKTYEVKYDENCVFHEEGFGLMYEKQLIDELLFGEKICLSSATELIKEFEMTCLQQRS